MSKTPICFAPWATLILNAASVNCCCFYPLEQEHLPFPSDKQSLMKIFNSKGFQKIRQRILDRDIAGTPCETCIERQIPAKEGETPFGGAHTPAHHKAWRAALDSAQRGETIVSHQPLTLSLNTSGDCNLRCVMCYNSNLPKDSIKGSAVPHERFISLIEDMGMENILGLTAVGGETFMTRDALAIIEHISTRQDAGMRLSTNTNGSLLHKHFDLLSRFRHLSLELSIEGYEESYERIRRGASWKRLMENLDWCSQTAKDRPGWLLSINSVIMKTSLPHMKQIVELARQKAQRIRFTPIMGDYFDENIFQFPELLEGMPWRQYFEEAQAAAQKAGFALAVQNLDSARKRLEKIVSHKGRPAVFIGSCETFDAHLRFIETQCPGTEVVVMGTRDYSADFLSWCRGKTSKHLTVAGKNITDTTRPYAGWPTAPLERLPESTQSILLCCRTYEYAEYSDLAARLYPHLPVRSLPYWDEAALQEVERLAVELAGKPVVLYAAGGTADVLLRSTGLAKLTVAAFSDGNPVKHGTTFLGKAVVPPADIPALATDVVILSENYSHSIANDLTALHGDALRLHRIF